MTSYKTIAENLIQIDTLLGGWEHVTAGYLFLEEEPTLIETGSQSSVKTLIASLNEIGIEKNDLQHVIVTHIHLDHAGGVGDVAKHFNKATVYVHEKGARHLADPARLINSASLVYGPYLDSLYGRLNPTEKDQIKVVYDNDEIKIGKGRALKIIDSPGHAKHHLAIFDSGERGSNILFCGDAVGVKLPEVGILRPSSPPSDFDLEKALNSLEKFKSLKPTSLALAHFGVIEQDSLELLEEAQATLNNWASVAKKAFEESSDIEAALHNAFSNELLNVDEQSKERLNVLSGIHSNAMGLKMYLERQHGAPDTN